MAVNLTVAQLAVELRLIAAETDTIPPGISAVLTRVLAAAKAAVDAYAPNAPQALANEAAIRLASVLYDQAGSQSRGGNPVVQSGAAALLSRHRTRSAISPAGTAADGTPAAGTGVDEAAVNALIAAALAAVRQVPAATQHEVGRVLGVGSDRRPFWNTALSVLLSALGSLTGRAGQYLRVGTDEASIVFGTAPESGNQSGGADATARAAAAANRVDIDSLLALGLDFTDVSLLKHLPVTHTFTPSDDVRVYFVTPHTYAGLDSAAKYRALAWQVTASETNLRTGGRMLTRVPIADVDAESFTRGYILHLVGGQVALNLDFRKIASTEQFRDDDYVYFSTAQFAIHTPGDGTGYDHTWRFQDYTITVAIGLAQLAAAVLARMAPALTGQGGKFLRVKSDATAVELVDAPGGGGISAPSVLATESLSGNLTTFETTWRLPSTARAIQIEAEGAAPSFRSPLLWSARLRALPAASSGSGQLTTANSFAVEAYNGGYVRIGRDSVYRLLIQRSGQTSAGSWNTTLTILGW